MFDEVILCGMGDSWDYPCCGSETLGYYPGNHPYFFSWLYWL